MLSTKRRSDAPIYVLAIAATILASALLRGSLPVAHAAPDAQDVSLSAAMRVIDAAIKKAQATETKMNIAVVDRGGNLKAFVRMDGAYIGSIDIALKKARTSRFFDAPSGALGTMTQPGGPLYGLEETNDGLVTFAGGLPLKNADGEVIGAVGVSGSSVENDLAVAEAGAAAF